MISKFQQLYFEYVLKLEALRMYQEALIEMKIAQRLAATMQKIREVMRLINPPPPPPELLFQKGGVVSDTKNDFKAGDIVNISGLGSGKVIPYEGRNVVSFNPK